MDNPVDMGNAPKPFRRFGIRVRASPIGGAFPAQRAETRFQMVRMNVFLIKLLRRDTFDTYEIEPPALPDLFAERPVLCFGKWRGERQGTMTLTGRIGEQEYRYEVDASTVEPQQEHAALRYLWARHLIMLLDDYNKLQHDQERVNTITELGLKYSLLTDYTSFIAIDSEVRNKEGQQATVNQPLPMPQGVVDGAIRSLTAFSAPMAASASFGRMATGMMDFALHEEAAVEPEMEMLEESFTDFGPEMPAPQAKRIKAPGRRGILSQFFPPREKTEEQVIAGKTFRLQNDVWVDVKHSEKSILIRIQHDSAAYRALLKMIAKLKPYFEAEERIIVNIGRYSVEITPEGDTELPREELQQLLTAWNVSHSRP